MTNIVFVDTETTGLDPFLHDAWEFALIVRRDGHDTEYEFRLQPDITNAEPAALKVNRYYERTRTADWRWDDPYYATVNMYRLLNGAIMVGSNPAFDAEMLRSLFARYYEQPRSWHYRTIDVATLAAGYLHGLDTPSGNQTGQIGSLPWSSRGLSRAVGIEPPGDDVAHTALADARWAKAVYDAVTGGGQ